jgi:Tfp pilus assembly protein PilX
MTKQGQATLEFTLVFIVVVALIMGLLTLWGWSKNNISSRQSAFEGTRVQAGTKESAGVPEVPFNANSPGEPRYLSR